MSREEQTDSAYQDYLNDEGIFQLNLWSAFKAGADWADENPNLASLWHDASEEPQYKNKRILVHSENFDYSFTDFPNYLMIKDGGQNKNWETVVLRNKISKWAYINDLLPKGGKK